MNTAREESVPPILVVEREAARRLGISLWRLRTERKRGNIRCKQIGSQYFYALAVLEAYAMTTEEAEREHPLDLTARRIDAVRGAPGHPRR